SVYFHHPLPRQPNGIPVGSELTRDNVEILGGVRIQKIRVENVAIAGDKLTVKVDTAGDFSLYTLRLIKSPDDSSTPGGFDPQLAEIQFSFKAGCPSEFDCRQTRQCPPEQRVEPDINYLAKDYASFRQLMLDRLSVLVPDWKERHAADVLMTLAEALAYV